MPPQQSLWRAEYSPKERDTCSEVFALQSLLTFPSISHALCVPKLHIIRKENIQKWAIVHKWGYTVRMWEKEWKFDNIAISFPEIILQKHVGQKDRIYLHSDTAHHHSKRRMRNGQQKNAFELTDFSSQ